MEDRIFHIQFQVDGKEYTGMVNPTEKLRDDGMPASFHVVLNHVNFGYLSFNQGKWHVNEQRPDDLTEAAGLEIEKHYKKKKPQAV